MELWNNWQNYGFESAERAHQYTSWILRHAMRSLAEGEEGQKPGFGYDGKFGTEMGYQGLTTVEQVMERYPIDEFEADRDIKEGRVRSFPSVEAAIEYLRTQINS